MGLIILTLCILLLFPTTIITDDEPAENADTEANNAGGTNEIDKGVTGTEAINNDNAGGTTKTNDATSMNDATATATDASNINDGNPNNPTEPNNVIDAENTVSDTGGDGQLDQNEKDDSTTHSISEADEGEQGKDEVDEDNNNVIVDDPLKLPSNWLPTCDSDVYCQGNLLHTVQMSRVYNDSKYFVDMSMIHDPGTTMANFKKMMKQTGNNPSKADIKQYVEANFQSQQEVKQWTPTDYVEHPCFLNDIRNQEIKQFASNIISLWKELGSKVIEEVFFSPEKYSIIPLPFGYISSGGRYNEYYYWDTYWIVDSLIICGMIDTVKGIIDNFVMLITKYGFVPNGGRIYYIHRTQPPMLPFIVMKYYEETTDIMWLKAHIDYFEQEMQFWVNNRMVPVVVGDKEYYVGMYKAETEGARPEVYYEDVNAAEYFDNPEEKQKYFANIKSSAESGWDSSSRWIVDAKGGTNANLTFSQISSIVPVDLNALLYGAFSIMSNLYLDLENYAKQSYWRKQAKQMYLAINKIFWNDDDGIWYDYDMKSKTQRKHFYASNFFPLWTNAFNVTWCKRKKQIEKVINYMNKHRVLNYPGGIPSSLQKTGGQWDMPNVWPLMQSVIVNGLYKSGERNARKVAKDLAKKFLNAAMTSYKNHGAMYQRYDATHLGSPGPGGEYETQKVFAWTNAVAIQFINKFYTE